MDRRSKILTVDDDETMLELFKEVLEHEGWAVVQARDGVEALEKFDRLDPDLVLLDLMLPRLNGFDICSRLRHNARSRHVPIIMLSGVAERDAKVRALEQGVNEFLLKPIAPAELVSRVRAALNLHLCHKCREEHLTRLTAARDQLHHVRQSLTTADQLHGGSTNPGLTQAFARLTEHCERLEQILG